MPTAMTVVVLIVVLIVTYLVGFVVGWALRWLTNSFDWGDTPENIRETATANHDEIVGGGETAGKVLGWLERLLYITAIWQGVPILIGVWLATKVGTKWNSWSKVFDAIEFTHKGTGYKLTILRNLTWRISQSFLLGNLLNILFAILIYAFAAQLLSLLSTDAHFRGMWP